MHHLALRLALAATIAMSPAAPVAAQDFPTQTVKFVVPAAAGSTTDALARILAEHLGRRWGKPTIVENIAGGAMNIGARSVARSAPDGHTLLVAPPSPLSFSHVLYKDPGYEPGKFVPITMLAKIANVLVVKKDLPAASVADLVAWGKANPGKLTYASSGVGSTAHLSASQLEARAGIKMTHVPYRGAQLALNDLVAGHIDLFFDTLATSVPLYQAKQVRLLAVADATRASAAPEIATFDEAGFPGFRSITWFGLVAPPGTPEAVAARLNRDAVETLRSREVSELLRKLSLEVGATSQADTARFFADEAALWIKVIKEAGLEPQAVQ